ncbi:MAG: restriction endonuclease [Acidimicrobiales bacterium]
MVRVEPPFEFERWAVSLVDGQSYEKQVGDKGIDGIVRFPLDKEMNLGRIIVSVKGGRQLNPGMVRDLRGTVEAQNAAMGVLLTMHQPTSGMIKEANGSGSFVNPFTGRSYPELQILTVPDMFLGKRPNMPTPLLPYVKAPTFAGWQQSFDEM